MAIFFSGMASYFAQPSSTIAVANPNVNALTIKPESVAKMLRLELIKINKYKVYDEFDMNEMEADHITPWHKGGKTIAENCQMLCKQDKRIKSGQ